MGSSIAGGTTSGTGHHTAQRPAQHELLLVATSVSCGRTTWSSCTVSIRSLQSGKPLSIQRAGHLHGPSCHSARRRENIWRKRLDYKRARLAKRCVSLTRRSHRSGRPQTSIPVVTITCIVKTWPTMRSTLAVNVARPSSVSHICTANPIAYQSISAKSTSKPILSNM